MADPGQQKCARCGTSNSIDAVSCRSCGRMLDGPTLPQPPPIKQQSPAVSPSPGGNISATSWQIPPAPGRAGPVPRRGGSSTPRMWPRPGFRLPIPRLPHNLPYQFRRKVNTIIIIFIVVIIVIMLAGALFLYKRSQGATPTPTPVVKSGEALPKLPDGLGVVPFPNGQNVGINDGSFPAFDVYPQRMDSAAKAQAMQALKKQDWQTAGTVLTDGLRQDTNDAEAKIYLENIHAVTSGNFITLVVAVDFVQPFPDAASQRTLRGAYTLQNEVNSGSHGAKLRLLIANTASELDYVAPVARQIVQIAKQEHVVGVLGWPTSRSSLDALPILAAARIPMVSPSASSDALTNISPYFFRVVPPNIRQAQTLADFAKQGLNAKSAVVFFDSSDSYSSNIVSDFEADYTNEGGRILSVNGQTYTNGGKAVGMTFATDKTDKLSFVRLIQQAIKQRSDVDVFYFAGVTLHDAILFQDALPLGTSGKYATLPVIAGDGAYAAEPSSYGRWNFTAYAYPDEWSIITKGHAPFFDEYTTNFDPSHAHSGDYEFDRPNSDAILAYDAATALMKAVQMASPLNSPQDIARITPQDVAAQMPRVTFQGMSGYIAFNADGNPRNKAIVVLDVSQKGNIEMNCIGSGIFYPGIDQSQIACHA